MTSTIHPPTDSTSATNILRRLLDDAAETFKRPPQVTFTISGQARGLSWRAFVASNIGEVVCIDVFLRHFIYSPDLRDGGFAMRQRTQMNAHQISQAIIGALSRMFGKDYAENVVVREVR